MRLILLAMICLGWWSAMDSRADDNVPPPARPESAPVDPMAQINIAIAQNPHDPVNYILRGDIYSRQKVWAEARASYEKALELDPQNSAAKFNLASILFRQKLFDQAKPGFAALEKDEELGDLASYMVFLCDLMGGHEDAAGKELAVFDAVGEHASYYFANAAWDIVHHNSADAGDYLRSAIRIYAPSKVKLYTVCLEDSGYLPLKN